MVTRKSTKELVQANLSIDKMHKGIARLEKVVGEIEAFDAIQLTKRFGPEQTALEATISGTLTSVFGHDTVEYKRYSAATKLDHGGIFMSFDGNSRDGGADARNLVAKGKVQAVLILKETLNKSTPS